MWSVIKSPTSRTSVNESFCIDWCIVRSFPLSVISVCTFIPDTTFRYSSYLLSSCVKVTRLMLGVKVIVHFI